MYLRMELEGVKYIKPMNRPMHQAQDRSEQRLIAIRPLCALAEYGHAIATKIRRIVWLDATARCR